MTHNENLIVFINVLNLIGITVVSIIQKFDYFALFGLKTPILMPPFDCFFGVK